MNTSLPSPDNSDNDPQIFTFNGIDIPVRNHKGQKWWDASPVCNVLEIANVSQAVSRLDDDEHTIIINVLNGVPVRNSVVNQAGLFSLVLGSRKPESKAFKRWLTHEVLPALQSTGTYSMSSLTEAEMILAQAQFMVKIEREVKSLRKDVGEIVERLDNADWMTVKQYCNVNGIKWTVALLQLWGKAAKQYSIEHQIEVIPIADAQYGSLNTYHKDVLKLVCVPKPKLNGQLPLLSNGDK